MSYRDDSADRLEAPTAEGPLTCELAPRAIRLSVARRTVQIADGVVTIIEHPKPVKKGKPKKDRVAQMKVSGVLLVARDIPRDDLGIWMELDPRDPERRGMRRIFGVTPVSTLEPHGLKSLAVLDRFAQRLRVELDRYAGDVHRAIEVGRGHTLDKVLLCDHGDRYMVFARRLFRDRARPAITAFSTGKIQVADGKGKDREFEVHSRHGVDVIGDYVRFSDPDGVDFAKVSIPWIAPEDRRELARRIGQLIDPTMPDRSASSGNI